MGINKTKGIISFGCGIIATHVLRVWGVVDVPLRTLIIFMSIDLITGWVLSIVFKKSRKTRTGAFSSQTNFIGLFRKIFTLLIVAVANNLDILLNVHYIRSAVCISYIINEVISITENAGLMGVPLPPVIINALDILRGDKNDSRKSD